MCGVPTGRYGVLVLVPAPGNITRSGQKGHRSSKMDSQEEGGEDSEDDGEDMNIVGGKTSEKGMNKRAGNREEIGFTLG